jgi:hypothetical protein
MWWIVFITNSISLTWAYNKGASAARKASRDYHKAYRG